MPRTSEDGCIGWSWRSWPDGDAPAGAIPHRQAAPDDECCLVALAPIGQQSRDVACLHCHRCWRPPTGPRPSKARMSRSVVSDTGNVAS